MKHISLETKEAIVKQAISMKGREIADLAEQNNIGYSTLLKWIKAKRDGRPLVSSFRAGRKSLSISDKLNHLLMTSSLDESGVGSYCRAQGIYSHQLPEWKDELMSDAKDKKIEHQLEELRKLKAENKALKKDLNRKEKALAETSALLVLKKKRT